MRGTLSQLPSMVCFLLRYDLKFLVTGLPCYCNELNKKKLINLLVMSLNTNRLQTEREGRSVELYSTRLSASVVTYSWWREQLRQKMSKLPQVRKTNSLNKTSKTLCNGIWQKQLLILKFEKGLFVDQTILSWLKYGSSQGQVKV